ncbi:MAG: histidine kinase [Solirubrobacteraceae bacterium]
MFAAPAPPRGERSLGAARRESPARLDRSIETLERISTALCTAPDGPSALCDAVVEAAAHHFDAPWAAMSFVGDEDSDGRGWPQATGARDVPSERQLPRATNGTGHPSGHEPPHVIDRAGVGSSRGGDGELIALLAEITQRALGADTPLLVRAADLPDRWPNPSAAGAALAAAMPVGGEPAGVLAVGLAPDCVLDPTDLSILVTLANHAGVALHNAWLFQESERLRLRSEAVSRLAERRAAELERRNAELDGIRLRLEDTGRRELLGRERNRIARELHDSVAQQLLTIGMNLEWCRRHESTSEPVLERVTVAKSLARGAVDEIRSVIFELASEGQGDLRRALAEVIDDVVAGTRLRVSLRTYGPAQPISGAAGHALVQIAREALFNVVRHAGADRAWMMLRWQPHRVRLVVADDGQGGPRALARHLAVPGPAGRHFGLAGIAQRVRELGGTVSLRRRRGGGISLAVEIPLAGSGAVA